MEFCNFIESWIFNFYFLSIFTISIITFITIRGIPLNFHECFYDSIETRRTCFLSFQRKKRSDEKTENNLLTLNIKVYILFARAIIMLIARASSHRVINTIFNQSVHVFSKHYDLN